MDFCTPDCLNLIQRYKWKGVLQEKQRISSDHIGVGKIYPKSGETLCFKAFQPRSEKVGNRSEIGRKKVCVRWFPTHAGAGIGAGSVIKGRR